MINALIFDLGNVLYLLDERKFTNCFAEKGVDLNGFYSDKLFIVEKLYETGKISTSSFFEQVRNILKINITFNKFVYCWNSLLRGFIKENADLLNYLSFKYPIFVLSNINDLHWQKVRGEGVFDLLNVKKFYFSHFIGFRKPQIQSFDLIVKENGLIPGKTLFIDDCYINIQKAKNLGFKTIWLESPFLLRKKLLEYTETAKIDT